MRGHNYDHGRGDICKTCGKIHISPRGMLGKKNPNAFFKKGMIPWLKGLTKETDPRVAAAAQNMRGKKRSEIGCLNISIAQKKKHEEDPDYRVRQHPPGSNQKRKLTLIGHEVSEETRVKLSKFRTGKTWEEIMGIEKGKKAKEKLGNTLKGRAPWHAGLTKEIDPRLNKKSELAKEQWRDPDFKKMMLQKLRRVPTRPQMELFRLLSVFLGGLELEYLVRTNKTWRKLDIAQPGTMLGFEYDGLHWHQDVDADRDRDIELEEVGWSIIHFRGLKSLELENVRKKVGGLVS